MKNHVKGDISTNFNVVAVSIPDQLSHSPRCKNPWLAFLLFAFAPRYLLGFLKTLS